MDRCRSPPAAPCRRDEGVPTGVYVMAPADQMLERIPVPEDLVTNLAFGGPDPKRLYIVAGESLFSIRVNVSGHLVYPRL